jgi:NADPH:quinone reductase-like Zn-dependent oxidoreductase
MTAVRIHEHGGTDVLRYEAVADPEIRGDPVLIRVRASALNHWIYSCEPG